MVIAPSSGLYPFHWYTKLFLSVAERLPFKPSVRDTLRVQAHRGFQFDETFIALMEAMVANVRTRVLFPEPLTDDELQSIEVPTLVLIGAEEILYDPEAAISRSRLLMPNVDARIVPDANHLLPMERPGFVDAAIEEFLASPRADTSD